jgi:CHASE3 domain sensor protein
MLNNLSIRTKMNLIILVSFVFLTILACISYNRLSNLADSYNSN